MLKGISGDASKSGLACIEAFVLILRERLNMKGQSLATGIV
jgi:hypothetical protein